MTRRRWLVMGSTLLAGACSRKKTAGYPGYALIATAGEKSVAALDLTLFRLAKTVPLPAEPTSVLPGRLPGHSYVLTAATGSLHALNPEFQLIRSARLSDRLTGIRLTPDNGHLLAIAAETREIMDVDATSLRVHRRYQFQVAPRFIDLAMPGYIAVSTGVGGLVELVQLGSGQRWHCRLPGETGDLRFRADGQMLLVANITSQSLVALSVPALEVIAELPLAMTPSNLCFTTDGVQMFVSGEGMDGVAIVFPYRTLEVEQTVLAGRDPGVMACSQNPPYLFVGSASGTDVCILNVFNRKEIGIVDVTQRPAFITTTPDSQYALILDDQSGNAAIIHIPAIRSTWNAWSRKSGASLFTMLPVGAKPKEAVILPRTA